MKLYHGTSEIVARRALEEGLLPRSESSSEGNWEKCPSRDDLVYLTDAYALHFAASACEGDEKWAVIEVDTDYLDEYDLLPDEDFLEQVTRGQVISGDWDDYPHDGGMEERTAWFRDLLDSFSHLWRKSIEGLGNCAHRGEIPPEAITGVTIFDPSTRHPFALMALDPSISILNYMILKGKYRSLTRWFSGYDVEATELDPTMMAFLSLPEPPTGMREAFESLEKAAMDRSPLEVLKGAEE